VESGLAAEGELQAVANSHGGTPEAQIIVTTNPPFVPMRKASVYAKNNRIQKGAR